MSEGKEKERGAVKGGRKYWNEKCLVDKSEISEAWRGTRILGVEFYCDVLVWNQRPLSFLLSIKSLEGLVFEEL